MNYRMILENGQYAPYRTLERKWRGILPKGKPHFSSRKPHFVIPVLLINIKEILYKYHMEKGEFFYN